jgi:hypothetical protein
MNMCATQGVGLGNQWTEDGTLIIDLTINIYQDGFNASTLDGALQTLEYTVTRVKDMLLS